MNERRVYLDTNVICRVPDLQVSEQTAAAFAQLINLGGLRFVTSLKTRTEVLATPRKTRNFMLQFLVGLIEKIETFELEYGGEFGAGG